MRKKVKNNEPLFAFGGCLKLILKLAFVLIVISLIWIYFFTPAETKEVNETKADIVNNYDSTIYKSNDILRQLHNNKLQISDAKELISQFSLVELENIYYYLCVERFNSGNRPNYNKVAENINISTSKLKAIDNYYSEEIFPSLKEVIRNIYKNNPNLK